MYSWSYSQSQSSIPKLPLCFQDSFTMHIRRCNQGAQLSIKVSKQSLLGRPRNVCSHTEVIVLDVVHKVLAFRSGFSMLMSQFRDGLLPEDQQRNFEILILLYSLSVPGDILNWHKLALYKNSGDSIKHQLSTCSGCYILRQGPQI